MIKHSQCEMTNRDKEYKQTSNQAKYKQESRGWKMWDDSERITDYGLEKSQWRLFYV